MSDATSIYDQVPDDDTQGGRLYRARESKNLTVRELAWKLGVQQATVAKWESDRMAPNSHRLSVVAGILDVSLSWLLYGVGTGPVEIDDDIAGLSARFDKIVALHAQTASLLKEFEGDLIRRAQGS